jgi:hypothetical protein
MRRMSGAQRNQEMRMMILKGLAWAIGSMAVVGLIQKFW